jgi:hypothetical protein
VKQFNYLGCELSLDGEPDFDKKINRFQRICGTIRKRLKKIHTDTQMKFLKSQLDQHYSIAAKHG